MSLIQTNSPLRILAFILFTSLALAGCAKKTTLPDNPGDLGLSADANGATPGTQQDFTVNIGDRIFFDTDSSVVRADAQPGGDVRVCRGLGHGRILGHGRNPDRELLRGAG